MFASLALAKKKLLNENPSLGKLKEPPGLSNLSSNPLFDRLNKVMAEGIQKVV